MTVHGGDVREAAQEMGLPSAEILDFSANVNPRGLPPRAFERLKQDASDPRLLAMYPDRSVRGLREALSGRLGVPPEAIAVGPGAEALLGPILRSLRASRALVPVPAFSEYRRAFAQESVEYVPFPLDRDGFFRVPAARFCQRVESGEFGVVLLNNPHNPSGSLLDATEIRRILEAVNSNGGTLVLDEAFVDYAPRASVATDAAVREGLIVIRSLTKFYGCPALRVGYAVAQPEAVRRIVACLATWPVTQFAADTLAEAVEDRGYAEVSLRENDRERERLREDLTALGLTVLPSAANYLLIELGQGMPCAAELRARLIAKHRILIRNCDSYEGLMPGRFVRVAVRTREENCRLAQAIGEVNG
jgi:threonine-phosphate decarboxylase